MKNIILVIPVLLAGCVFDNRSPVSPAFLYSDVRGTHVATEVQSLPTDRQGRACAQNVLGLIANGDASVAAAKEEGGITLVTSVDYSSRTVLGMWSESCTIVSGR